MARLAAALRAHHLHMHKRDNLLYFAPPLVIARERARRGAGRRCGAALDEAHGVSTVNKVYPERRRARSTALRDGMTIMSAASACRATPRPASRRRRARRQDLTLVCNNCGNQGKGLAVLLKTARCAR